MIITTDTLVRILKRDQDHSTQHEIAISVSFFRLTYEKLPENGLKACHF